MSTVSGVNSMNELANTIIKNFDTNRDGALSADEFTSFLGRLLGSTTPQQGGASAPVGDSVAGLSTLFPSATAGAETARPKVGELLGFDERKLNNSEHVSFKYQIGRILQFYPATKDGLQQALAEIQGLVPGARIVGSNGDKIDFGDYNDPKSGKIGVVDVLVGASAGGRGWAWQPVE